MSQSELAAKADISQSALAQFETFKSSLSTEKITMIASLLNLNPYYLENEIGNPFKQTDPNKIIKLLLPESPLGDVDFSIVKLIAESNESAAFFFLKPRYFDDPEMRMMEDIARKEFAGWKKQYRLGRSVFALLIKDEDNNFILMKRRSNLLFSEEGLISELKETIGRKKFFEFNKIGIDYSAYEKIKDWAALNADLIEDLVKIKHKLNRFFILKLVTEIWSRGAMVSDQESRLTVSEKIKNMKEEELNRFLAILIPEIANAIKNTAQRV